MLTFALKAIALLMPFLRAPAAGPLLLLLPSPNAAGNNMLTGTLDIGNCRQLILVDATVSISISA